MDTFIRYLRMYLHSVAGTRRPIGYLSQYGDFLRVSFDRDYIDDPDRPTLSLSYRGRDDSTTRTILSSARDLRLTRSDRKWPSFFQNLLPEGHNRERLARERGCSDDDEFELLAAAGHDLMGAIEVEPVPSDEGVPEPVRLWHTAMGLRVVQSNPVESPVEDASSLPGVVVKFSAIKEGRRYTVRRRGVAGSHILKLPSSRHTELVTNEYTGYQLCQAVGLNCAEARIISASEADLPVELPFEDVLAVKRFDRLTGARRQHFEEFTQILGYEPRQKYGTGLFNDYSSMLRIISQLSAEQGGDTQEFIKRFVVFILMGNTDAHLKNWGMIYPNGVDPVLAPVYDPVCVTAFFDSVPASDYAVNRAIDAKLKNFSWDDLSELLKLARAPRSSRLMQVARATVADARKEWPHILDIAPASMRSVVMNRLNGGVMLTRR